MPEPTKQEEAKFDRTQKYVAALLFAMLFLNYLDRQVLAVLAPIMRTEIGLTQTDYAWAVDAFLLSYAVMYFGSGLILDKVGSRVGLTLFVGLWSLVSALHATVRGFWSLAVFRFLLGVTEPGGFTGAVKTVGERFNAKQRAIATGIFSMCWFSRNWREAVLRKLVVPPFGRGFSRHEGLSIRWYHGPSSGASHACFQGEVLVHQLG